jgi:hypothetical protein
MLSMIKQQQRPHILSGKRTLVMSIDEYCTCSFSEVLEGSLSDPILMVSIYSPKEDCFISSLLSYCPEPFASKYSIAEQW